jgi:hypothetical protein
MVRCAKCLHTWAQAPPEDMPKFVEPPVLEVEPRPIPPGSGLPALAGAARRRDLAAVVGWAALAALLVGILVGGLAYRDRIVEAWPPAMRLYAAIGQQAEEPGIGLELRNLSLSRSGEEDAPVLVLVGEVANVTDQVRDVPLLRGALVAPDEREIQHWTFTASQNRLLPGEIVNFRTELKNPAAEAVSISVTFTDAAEERPVAGERPS